MTFLIVQHRNQPALEVSVKPSEAEEMLEDLQDLEDERSPLTDFGRPLQQQLEQDREEVDPSSKYKAFWLTRGLSLASQYRQEP